MREWCWRRSGKLYWLVSPHEKSSNIGLYRIKYIMLCISLSQNGTLRPCISAIPLFSIVQVSRHLENSSWTQHLSISWEFSKWNINYNTYILWFVHWYKLSHKRERKYFADLICEGQGAVSFSFDGWNWSISRC